jgi:predicted TIM-barrel fold metal-dependent hydrolase
MFIDFHTHIFQRSRAPSILFDLSARGEIPHFTNGTLDGLLAAMETSGVELSLISRITTKKEQAGEVNQWLLGCTRPNVQALATVHPDLPVSCGDLEGLRRFFRKHPVERILFGSDSPFTDQDAELKYLLNLPFLSTSEKEKIAGGNAASLLF